MKALRTVLATLVATAAVPATALDLPEGPVAVFPAELRGGSDAMNEVQASRLAGVVAARLQSVARAETVPEEVLARHLLQADTGADGRCASAACRLGVAQAAGAGSVVSISVVPMEGRCRVEVAMQAVRTLQVQASARAVGTCDDEAVSASAARAASGLFAEAPAPDPGERRRLVAARNTGIVVTATGVAIMLAGGIMAAILAAEPCGPRIDGECTNSNPLAGAVVAVTVIPVGAAVTIAGAPVWGVYQNKLDLYDGEHTGVKLTGVSPFVDRRTGSAGVAASFTF